MKYCEMSFQCAWGDAVTPNRCGYRVDTDNFECPLILQNFNLKESKICGKLDHKSA